MTSGFHHPMPFGAQVERDGSVRFRLWGPGQSSVDLVLPDSGDSLPMTAGDGGWFSVETDRAGTGSAYAFRLAEGLVVPDPASRAQRGDVHGPSVVVDPLAYRWRCPDWTGRPWEEAVIYEIHVGTATREGTFSGLVRLLDRLAGLGVTALELMPVAAFAGGRNWGYDGVLAFAPATAYGPPEDLKALVDAAHERGMMVFLDVVYNHFGPEGNYLHALSPDFFTARRHTPWGDAIDFAVREVRDFMVHNALYWIREYRMDGLRLDAVHAIIDDSRPHILEEISAAVRAAIGPGRHVHLVLENDANEARHLRGDPPPYDAQWNDDFHHAAHVVLTGETDGYYGDYAEDPAGKLLRALTEGFVYQGEPSAFRGGVPRGERSHDLPPSRFVNFLQNHDQIGNRGLGDRLTALAEPDALRAMTAILLLSPSVPLLFMGEETASQAPFPFFCDFRGELADAVREGRRAEFARFAAFADPQARERIPDPNAPETFESARPWLDTDPPPPGDKWQDFVRELLAIRRRVVVPLLGRAFRGAETARAGASAFTATWRFSGNSRLRLAANIGGETVEIRNPVVGVPVFAVPHRPAHDDGNRFAPWSVLWSVSTK